MEQFNRRDQAEQLEKRQTKQDFWQLRNVSLTKYFKSLAMSQYEFLGHIIISTATKLARLLHIRIQNGGI